VNHAMDCVSAGIKNGGWYRDPKTGQPLYGDKKNTGSRSGAENQGYRPNQGSKMSEMRNYSQNRPVPVTPRYLKGTSVKIGGTFLAATGAVFGLTSVIFLIITLIGSLITAFDVVSGLIIGIFAVAFISFAVMTYVGVDMVRTVGRFRQYVSVLRDREFCDIKEIASATGRDVRKVLKDVKKMITKGWFCQGHLDEKESCLMVSEHAWNQYTALMEDMKQRKAEEQAAQKKMQEEYDRLSPEVQKIVQAGDEYVRKIKAANDAIPGEEISAKISRMELLVDRIFDAPLLYTGVENLLGVYGYALQIYCDFSGYSDMAIGIALWLGFRFNINFDSPYQSATITEFWRRWHISLSSWLKDYLYISLGGNRKGKIRTYMNLLITMLLGGLWHGASVSFILWGALHGIALAVHKFVMGHFSSFKALGCEMKPWRRVLGVLITFHVVCFGWILFRATSMKAVGEMLRQIFTNFHPEVFMQFVLGYKGVFALMVIGYVLHFMPKRSEDALRGVVTRSPLLIQAAILAIAIFIVVQFKSAGVQPFIYFQF